MDFLLILLLTLLNGLFAMSELALTASKKIHLQNMRDAGDKGAAAALSLLDNPTRFLSVVQVGITSIGMLNAIVGEAAFSDALAQWLHTALGLSQRAAQLSATAVVVTAITFVTIVFGELVPKRIGQLYPETAARLLSRPMLWVARVARPFVWLLSVSTHTVMRLLRIDGREQRAVTEEEITASLEEGVDAGIIEEHEHRMVRNVFHLDDRSLASMMQARNGIDWLDASWPVAQALEHVYAHGASASHSWYPVCKGSLEQVVGQISLARLAAQAGDGERVVQDLMAPAVFVPETLSGMELIEQFRTQSARLVLVVDEYGDLQGLVTPFDVLQAITGELQPNPQSQAWATLQADGSWLLDGLMPVEELKARLRIDEDLPASEHYNTLAGLLMAMAGRLLHEGDVVVCVGWEFVVLHLDGRRVAHVRAHAQVPLAADSGAPE
ncbi:MAG: hemolysin family protein [Rhodoferax sp.]